MDFWGEIAKQGLGYVLFLGSLLVLYRRENEHKTDLKAKDDLIEQKNKALSDISIMWIKDIKDLKDSYFANMIVWKEALQDSTNKSQSVLNNILEIVKALSVKHP